MGRVDDKVVIVTGAARGTGERTARLLVAEGATVVICDVQDALARIGALAVSLAAPRLVRIAA